MLTNIWSNTKHVSGRIEELGIKDILDVVHASGGWPTLGIQYGGRWNYSETDFMSDLVIMRRYGVIPFINIYISTDDKHLTERIIHVRVISTYCLVLFSSSPGNYDVFMTVLVGFRFAFKFDGL